VGGTAAPAAPGRYCPTTRPYMKSVPLPTATKGVAGPAVSRCEAPLAADAIPFARVARATRTHRPAVRSLLTGVGFTAVAERVAAAGPAVAPRGAFPAGPAVDERAAFSAGPAVAPSAAFPSGPAVARGSFFPAGPAVARRAAFAAALSVARASSSSASFDSSSSSGSSLSVPRTLYAPRCSTGAPAASSSTCSTSTAAPYTTASSTTSRSEANAGTPVLPSTQEGMVATDGQKEPEQQDDLSAGHEEPAVEPASPMLHSIHSTAWPRTQVFQL